MAAATSIILAGTALASTGLGVAKSVKEAKQAREAQRRITPPGMTYGEYMEYLKDKRQQLEEKKKTI